MRVGGGGKEDALTMVTAMLSPEGRQWGNQDENDGKEEVVEENDNGDTIAALGRDGRLKAGSISP